MAQYLVAVCRPNDYDPSVETEVMIEGIDALSIFCARQRWNERSSAQDSQ